MGIENTSEPAWLGAALALGPNLIWAALIAFALCYYREAVSAVLKRLIKFSTPVAEGEMAPPAGEVTQKVPVEAAEVAKAASAVPGAAKPLKWIPGQTPPLSEPAEEIKAFISGVKPRNDTADLALFWFACWGFEVTFRLIWGSQIELLKAVDVRGVISKDEAQAFYKTSVARGNKGQTFDQYILFLTSGWMIQPDASGNSYSKAPIGHQFLVYLQSQSIPLNRPL